MKDRSDDHERVLYNRATSCSPSLNGLRVRCVLSHVLSVITIDMSIDKINEHLCFKLQNCAAGINLLATRIKLFVGSILHSGPTKLFLVPASAPRLV